MDLYVCDKNKPALYYLHLFGTLWDLKSELWNPALSDFQAYLQAG